MSRQRGTLQSPSARGTESPEQETGFYFFAIRNSEKPLGFSWPKMAQTLHNFCYASAVEFDCLFFSCITGAVAIANDSKVRWEKGKPDTIFYDSIVYIRTSHSAQNAQFERHKISGE